MTRVKFFMGEYTGKYGVIISKGCICSLIEIEGEGVRGNFPNNWYEIVKEVQ